LESAGLLRLNAFVEDVLGLRAMCWNSGMKRYFLPTVQHYLRIKAWLVAMGEYEITGDNYLML
jgi:hypothetical protein